MHSKLLVIGTAALLLTLGNNKIARSQTQNAFQTIEPAAEYREIAEHLSRFLSRELKQKKIPAFSIALIDDDQIVWAQGFGMADPDAKRPATAETVYRVGSVSKLLNDVAVMQLVLSGQLQLDEDIRSVLPEFRPHNSFDRPITLRQLMNHTSGLVRESPRGNYFDDKEPSLEETVLSLNQTSLLHAPNSHTKYSNAAVSVSGLAIERVTGIAYSDYLSQKILKPLGMNSSSFLPNAGIRERLAKAQMWSYDGRRFEAPIFALGTLPAGNLYSNVLDLGKFMISIFHNGNIGGRQVLPEALYRQMLVPQTAADGQKRSYGIGFRIGQFQGFKTFEHGGAVYGFATQFRGIPERKLGVVAVASLDVANGFVSRTADAALQMMLARQDNEPLVAPASSGPVNVNFARQVAGLYQNGNQRRRLFESGGRLMLDGGTYTLEIRRHPDRPLDLERSSPERLTYIVDDVLEFGARVKFGKNQFTINQNRWERIDDPLPDEIQPQWKGLIGEYGWDHNTMFIYERHGQLWTLIEWVFHYPLDQVEENVFAFPDYGLYHGEHLIFQRDRSGQATSVVAAEVTFPRRPMGGIDGKTFKIRPLMEPERLRQIALSADPPAESREFVKPELVELVSIDPSLKLDIRYATTNNFMSSVFYRQPRAYLQRPAAAALVKVHQSLRKQGLGLMIYDAYRPWFVTKMFWEATPEHLKHFVANPEQGSRHNRGCAVDLTLFDLGSGNPVSMVAGYDEFSERAYPDYPGGTSRQRWYRRTLRQAMESAGFEIYEYEWWHFDYKLWHRYPILNQRFSEIRQSSK